MKKSETPSEGVLSELKKTLGEKLDEDFLSLIEKSNGIEGFVGESFYFKLWSIDEVLKKNPYYEDVPFGKEVFIFGSNGSDAGFAVLLANNQICELPYIGMNMDDTIFYGTSFMDFLKKLGQS